ncbi:MAG: HAD family hydrolase [Faecousia sp.]
MKNYLICIDSDGCAIDSMEIKHRRCFGPCIIDVWHLEEWKTPILERWNEINLYSMTRGINRFLGLEKMLAEIHTAYTEIDGLPQYRQWCQTTATFSNAAIEAELRASNHPIFQKVLDWSHRVNQKIEEISEEIRPFTGVKQALETLHGYAYLAVVSSANPQAVQAEWSRFGFLSYMDYVMAQDAGTKADCIRKLMAQGYASDRILVLGDAPGDAQAAEENHILYYPILAGHEAEAWERLITEALPRLLSGAYSGAYQQALLAQFYENLGGASTCSPS